MSLLYANSIYRKGNWQSKHSGIVIKDVQNITIKSGDEFMQIDSVKCKNLMVKDLMEFYGFKNEKTYYLGEAGEVSDGSDENRNYKDTHKNRVAIGYKNIEYHGLYKTVIGIVIRGTAEDDDWDSDFDMGDIKLYNMLQYGKEDITYEEKQTRLKNYNSGKAEYSDNYDSILNQLGSGILQYDSQYSNELLHFAGGYPDWINKQHHAGFDIVANRMLEIIKEYMQEHESDFGPDEYDKDEVNNVVSHSNGKDDTCSWITGHSMGGGVANLIGASLVDGYCGGNPDNVYCYTFAAPNTFYYTDNGEERDSTAIPGHKVLENYKEPHGVNYIR